MKIKSGFTLIETIVVIAVIGLTLPLLFAIIFIIIQQQVKVYHLQEVKRQGDNILSLMENTIRSSGSQLYSGGTFSPSPSGGTIVCTTTTTTPQTVSYFYDKSNQWFYYILSGTNIASYSALLSGAPLNSSKVRISNFNVSCTRTTTYSTPILAISFDVSYITSSSRPEDIASLGYQTRLKLTSY